MELNSRLTDKGQRDYVLIQRAVNESDQQAYADLHKHYRDSLYYMMLKMTGDPTDAEDLTIEAFGKAFKNLKQYTPDYAFSTWLFKIATNNCIDFLRKKSKIEPAVSIDRDDEQYHATTQIATPGLNPEETFIKDQKIELMRSVVQQLKPHYRVLVELRYFKEYSYEEIVDELELPIGTVKAQLFRARDRLYSILQESRDRI
jgi:RNA polymerase sigma-70 factor (ECF subfamily)